jgi:predicted AAA+ superfamily ATPase
MSGPERYHGVVATSYVRRLVDDDLPRLLAADPAVLLVGPRAAGKTTTARRYAASVVRLDRPAEAAAFAADPDAALARVSEPVLLDEWQAVPEVLGAVKRAVDDDSRPGRFLLTGSVRADLDAQTWPGTGRLIRLSLHSLNEREIAAGTSERNPIDVLAQGDPMALGQPDPAPDLPGYIGLALRGGFPDATLRLDGRDRDRWLESYLNQIITRDAVELSGRDPARMVRYVEVLALNSAGIVADSTIYEAAGIDRKTALAYERLLTNLFVLDVVPAWLTNRLSRLVKTPKRYLTDASLVGAALRVDEATVMRDGDLMGRVLDTFVAAQLRPEIEVSALRPRLFHLRDKNGRHEIDLLAELGGDRIVAVEVKASASPARRDAAHLEWLRDRLGERFLSGAVLHTGPRAFPLSERIAAVPIAALWSSNSR